MVAQMDITSTGITGLIAGVNSTDAVNFSQIHVLQTPVSATTTSSTATTSATFVATNITATITPTTTSGKILIIVSGCVDVPAGAGGNAADMTLFRGSSTNLGSAQGFCELTQTATVAVRYSFSIVYLDSPATTSATSYTVYVRNNGGAAGTLTVASDTTTQSIVLIEVI